MEESSNQLTDIMPFIQTSTAFCYFTVHKQVDGTILLHANNGNQLRRYKRYESLKLLRPPGKLVNQHHGKLPLQGDRGKYWSMVHHANDNLYIMALNDKIDSSSKFTFSQNPAKQDYKASSSFNHAGPFASRRLNNNCTVH